MKNSTKTGTGTGTGTGTSIGTGTGTSRGFYNDPSPCPVNERGVAQVEYALRLVVVPRGAACEMAMPAHCPWNGHARRTAGDSTLAPGGSKMLREAGKRRRDRRAAGRYATGTRA